MLADNLPQAVCDDGVRLVPGGLGQHPVTPDEGLGQPVGIVVELAEARPLRTGETRAEDVTSCTASACPPALGDLERQAAVGLAKGTDPQGSPGISHARIFLRLRRRVNASWPTMSRKVLCVVTEWANFGLPV